MEGCLLCLELKKGFAECININSNQWTQLSIQNLVEKHLWPMNHMNTTSWLCSTCWSELYEFHKFYIRVEEAHIDFGLLPKNIGEVNEILCNNEKTSAEAKENEINPIDVLVDNPVEELKDFLNEYDLGNTRLETEVIIEDQKPLIKDELIEEQIIDEDMPLLQRRKRGRPRKDVCNGVKECKTPLNNPKKLKQRKIKDLCSVNSIKLVNKRKQSKVIETLIKDISKQTSLNDTTFLETKEPHLTSTSEGSNALLQSNDNNTDCNCDTDCESLNHVEIKPKSNSNNTAQNYQNEKDKFLAENFKITCFLCNIPLETFLAMRKHFEVHHTEPGHVKCCNKKFYRRSVLVDHVHRHLDPNYFKCNQCGKVMADRRCLVLHIETHESNPEKNHCCDICGKGFAKLGVLKKHRMIHLSEEEKRFPCSECGKNFASNYLLSSHYRSVHLNKYAKICDICGKSIRCKDVFKRHMLQHEGKIAPTVGCDVCGLRLTDNKALKRHKEMIHPVDGKHEYTCSMCSKVSPNLKAHKRHVQFKHIMGYDHKCTICEKAFKRAQTLREHMASHTGTILYTCPWCPKTFNSNANMHNHRKKVHPKQWEEATRKRYSGNLPPNYKPPATIQTTDFPTTIDI